MIAAGARQAHHRQFARRAGAGVQYRVSRRLLSDYRRPFWRAARHALRRGQIDAVLGMGFVAYHLIEFSREALRGDQNASFYSTLKRERKLEVAAVAQIGVKL